MCDSATRPALQVSKAASRTAMALWPEMTCALNETTIARQMLHRGDRKASYSYISARE